MKNSRFRISYDPQIFTMQKYGGVSRYFSELACELSKNENISVSIVAPLSKCEYLKKFNSKLVRGYYLSFYAFSSNKRFSRLMQLFFRAISLMAGDLYLRFTRPNLIHETYFLPFALGPKEAIRILTIYDMIHEKFPQGIQAADRTSKYKAQAAKRADHIICISESTRKDAIEILGLDPRKVSVVHLGFNSFPLSENNSKLIGVLKEKSPYLLYVGQRGGYKNFKNLILAYAASKKLQENFKIICFGGGKLTNEEILLLDKNKLTKESVFQCDGGDDQLGYFFKNAAAFIYPSIYEGFGIPPLEAMENGCPIVCSNSSSIPEVVGNAAEYFDPNGIESIRFAIERVVLNEEIRQKLIARGSIRKENFSWKKCADETLKIYTSVTKNNKIV
jgi:glycosyltransferase involved in cell wall biosynthesis